MALLAERVEDNGPPSLGRHWAVTDSSSATRSVDRPGPPAAGARRDKRGYSAGEVVGRRNRRPQNCEARRPGLEREDGLAGGELWSTWRHVGHVLGDQDRLGSVV
jgi:hypothetical protein